MIILIFIFALRVAEALAQDDIGKFHWLDDTWDRSRCGSTIDFKNKRRIHKTTDRFMSICQGSEVVNPADSGRVGWVIDATSFSSNSDLLGIAEEEAKFNFEIASGDLSKVTGYYLQDSLLRRRGSLFDEYRLQTMAPGDTLTIVIDAHRGELLMQVNKGRVVVVDAGEHIKSKKFRLIAFLRNSDSSMTIQPPQVEVAQVTALDQIFKGAKNEQVFSMAYKQLEEQPSDSNEELYQLILRSLAINQTAHKEWLRAVDEAGGRLTGELISSLRAIVQSKQPDPDEKLAKAFKVAGVKNLSQFYELHQAVKKTIEPERAAIERHLLLSLLANERVHKEWLDSLVEEGNLTDTLLSRLQHQALSPEVTVHSPKSKTEKEVAEDTNLAVFRQIVQACLRLKQVASLSGFEAEVSSLQLLIHELFRQFFFPLRSSQEELRSEILKKAETIEKMLNKLYSPSELMALGASSGPCPPYETPADEIIGLLLDAVKAVEGFGDPSIKFEDRWKEKLPEKEDL